MHHPEFAISESSSAQYQKPLEPPYHAPGSSPLSRWLVSRLRQYQNPVIVEHGKEIAAADILSSMEKMRSALAPLCGKVVLLKETTGKNFLNLLFGLIEAGAIIAPISPETSPDETARLASSLYASSLVSWCKETDSLTVTELEQNRSGLRDAATGPRIDGPAFIRFTSGTTGNSKGVLIGAESALFRAQSAAAGLSLTEGDGVLWLLPMEFHFVAMLLAVIEARATFVVKPHQDDTSDTLVSVIYCSPKEIREMLSPEYPARRLQRLKSVLCTTGPLFHHERERFFEKFQLRVSPIYGAIEVGLGLGSIRDTSLHPSSDGFPFPGYEAKITAEGTLAFRSEGLFRGYLPDAWSHEHGGSRVQDQWFTTSDLARELPDGSFQILGRAESIIHQAGRTIVPEEIESLIMELPFVKECLVAPSSPVASPEDLESIKVQANIVVSEKKTKEDEQELRSRIFNHLKRHPSGADVLNEVVFVKSLPKTKTGKLSRTAPIQELP